MLTHFYNMKSNNPIEVFLMKYYFFHQIYQTLVWHLVMIQVSLLKQVETLDWKNKGVVLIWYHSNNLHHSVHVFGDEVSQKQPSVFFQSMACWMTWTVGWKGIDPHNQLIHLTMLFSFSTLPVSLTPFPWAWILQRCDVIPCHASANS